MPLQLLRVCVPAHACECTLLCVLCVSVNERVRLCCVCLLYILHRVTKLLEPQGVFQAAVSDRQRIYVLGMLHATQMPGEAVEKHWLVPVEEAILMVAEQLGPEGVELRPSSAA